MAKESKMTSDLQARIITVLKCSNGARLALFFAIFTANMAFAQGSRTATVHGHAHDVAGLADLYMSGKLKLDELISRRLKLEEINSAFDELKRGGVARSVIVFDA